jgi:2-polyprenyl-6-methoxyphenol hydroxylase-like FAD-dependent oxidoreductase
VWDVIVAGAGPAGSVAAYTLARAGHRTLLADNLAGRGSKIGETIPGAAVRLLRSFGLPAPEIDGPHRSVSTILSSWNSPDLLARYPIRDPYGTAWRLDRDTFDADLRLAAIAGGVTFRTNHVGELQTQSGCWEVRFCDGAIEHTKWIVDATGRRAALARRLAVNRLRDERLIAFYGVGRIDPDWHVDRTIMEAVSEGWWYAARLPSGAPIAGFHTHARKAADLRTRPDAWTAELIQPNTCANLFPQRSSTSPREHSTRALRVSPTSTEIGGLHAETRRCVLTPFQAKGFSQRCRADMRLRRLLFMPSTATPQSSPSIPRRWKMRGRSIAHGRESFTEANDAGKTPASGHVNDSRSFNAMGSSFTCRSGFRL